MKDNNIMRVGIIGTGWIAEKAAITLAGLPEALLHGLKEPSSMPLDETLYIMQLMDDLRRRWGVRYPMDE